MLSQAGEVKLAGLHTTNDTLDASQLPGTDDNGFKVSACSCSLRLLLLYPVFRVIFCPLVKWQLSLFSDHKFLTSKLSLKRKFQACSINSHNISGVWS